MRIFAGLLASLLAMVAQAQVYSIFSPGPSGPVKSNGSYALQSEVAADIIGLWSGTCSASTFLSGSGACANPVAGSTNQIQYNSGSNTFAASSLLTFTPASVVVNVGAGTTPGTFSVGQLDTMVINGVTVPIPGFALNSNIQGVFENHSYVNGVASGGARYYGVRSEGTISSPAIVVNGDHLSTWYAAGYNGTNYSLGASIMALVDGTPGASAMPTDLDFAVSPAGSQVPTSRLTLKTDGSYAVSGSVGTSGQFLTSGGPGAAASWSTAALAAGPAGAVQFSDGSGHFQGVSDLLFSSGSDTLTLGGAALSPIITTTATTGTGSLSITTGAPGASSTGQAINITGGTGGATAGNGGAVTVTGGSANGTGNHPGGQVLLVGGTSVGISPGGAATLQGGIGAATQSGGSASVIGGAGGITSGGGGAANVTGGSATNGVGGNINLTSGSGSTAGNASGAINILTGNGNGTGNSGGITLTTGTSGGTVGTLRLGTGGVTEMTIGSNQQTSFAGISAVDTLVVNAGSGSHSLVLNGGANAYTEALSASSTASQSFGLVVSAGTNANDSALLIRNAATTTAFLNIDGNGSITTGGQTAEGVGTLNTAQYYRNNLPMFPVIGVVSCGAGGCTALRATGMSTTVTRAGPGQYTVTFSTSFAGQNVCFITIQGTTAAYGVANPGASSTTVNTFNSAGTLTDTIFGITCT